MTTTTRAEGWFGRAESLIRPSRIKAESKTRWKLGRRDVNGVHRNHHCSPGPTPNWQQPHVPNSTNNPEPCSLLAIALVLLASVLRGLLRLRLRHLNPPCLALEGWPAAPARHSALEDYKRGIRTPWQKRYVRKSALADISQLTCSRVGLLRTIPLLFTPRLPAVESKTN